MTNGTEEREGKISGEGGRVRLKDTASTWHALAHASIVTPVPPLLAILPPAPFIVAIDKTFSLSLFSLSWYCFAGQIAAKYAILIDRDTHTYMCVYIKAAPTSLLQSQWMRLADIFCQADWQQRILLRNAALPSQNHLLESASPWLETFIPLSLSLSLCRLRWLSLSLSPLLSISAR